MDEAWIRESGKSSDDRMVDICWLALLLLLGSRGDQGPANSRGVAVSEFTRIPYQEPCV